MEPTGCRDSACSHPDCVADREEYRRRQRDALVKAWREGYRRGFEDANKMFAGHLVLPPRRLVSPRRRNGTRIGPRRG